MFAVALTFLCTRRNRTQLPPAQPRPAGQAQGGEHATTTDRTVLSFLPVPHTRESREISHAPIQLSTQIVAHLLFRRIASGPFVYVIKIK